MLVKVTKHNFLTVLFIITHSNIQNVSCHSTCDHNRSSIPTNNYEEKIIPVGRPRGFGLERRPILLSKDKTAIQEDDLKTDSLEIDHEEDSTQNAEERLDSLDADDSTDELTLEHKEGEFVQQKHDKLAEELSDENPQLMIIMDELVQLSISLRDITHKIEKL
ncbi:hypothetical protein BMR1_02g00375 [Babesia microti strain RI]|uniref:Uncharacterized protein n=1 Tax=Babesia microti (strain RI) TaxID=1133968 RepID=I7IG07_BABMR|nr:hypothetical protein BMR1_02g00375 [Babesia microti strain RI]CCF73241.1 hypothetical protein BMR1_02g00375 [Babesia microti strain RI]|eukprot:XP_012647850.1 hypothetical protein BMR1_02g00375 [Babesia microti strain RI]